MDHLNTEGVSLVGEIDTRALKEVQVAEDFRNAYQAGQVKSYNETLIWVSEQIRHAGPYDDTRHMEFLVVWLGDKIREVQPPATMEARNA